MRNVIFFALIFSGIALTIYLTYLTFEIKYSCPIYLSSCEEVFKSEYSYLLGIPTSIYGIIGFIGLLIFYLIKQKMFFIIWSFIGISFIIFLQYVQIFITGICFLCTISHVLFILSSFFGIFLKKMF